MFEQPNHKFSNTRAVRVDDSEEDLTRNIIKEIGLGHPIMFDSHNLCKITSSLQSFPCECCKTHATFMNWTPRQSLQRGRNHILTQMNLSKVIITFLKTSCFIQWRLRELLTPITNAVKKLPSPSAISIATMHRFSNFSPISIGGQFT